MQLIQEKSKALSTTSTTSKPSTTPRKHPNTPKKTTPPSAIPTKSYMSPIAMSSPFNHKLKSLFLSPPSGGDVSAESGFLDQTSDGSPPNGVSDDSGSDAARRPPKFLSQEAIDVLMEWYLHHEDHPYADDEMCRDVAVKAGIDTSQVGTGVLLRITNTCGIFQIM